MKVKFLIFILVLVAIYTKTNAQDTLQVEELIALTIENNFDIHIASNNIQISKNNNNIGLVGGSQSTGGTVSGASTGMLPQISVAAGSPTNPLGLGQTISTLKYSTPQQDVTRQSLFSTSYAPSIIGTWYFFDGLKMFATKKKLNRFVDLSNLNYRLAVENALLPVLTAYYQMISIEQFIKSLNISLELGEYQKKLAEIRNNTGTGSGVEVLQTQIDYNNIQVQIIQQQTLLNDQRVTLNNLLGRAPDFLFNVPSNIVVKTEPQYENALAGLSNNNTIRVNMKQIEIDELGMKEFKANRYPKIGVTGNYTYSHTESSVGLQRLNNNYGYNLGLIFSWTILNNLTTNTAIKNQLINLKNDNLTLQMSKVVQRGILYQAYISFKNNLDIMEIEKKSVELASQNLQIAAQRYKQGAANYIEYHTVEQSYETAVYRLSQAAYNTKVSELNYLKAQGLLVY